MVDPYADDIELVSSIHDEWRDRFREESERVEDALAERGLDGAVVRIEHVGSTAVPGLAAKDIIDLDVVVAEEAVPDVSSAMVSELGGDRHENSDAWHPVFRAVEGQRFNDHVFARSADGWRRSVVTREVLRADPAVRAEYESLKRRLAADYDDMDEYSREKTAFVDGLLETARERDLGLDVRVPAP
ncbi:GrpB family protein [Halorarum halophilum]|uniref:GrpB family protein n=1 Tax=Halorarum halophilum TaxID=2743090 RepID=A0A7D5GIR0_9EURY|nr:GrpB family protein [Halobaculum halophilum]QLG26347.1 GrpB family protein [Halobaculum halophilum]